MPTIGSAAYFESDSDEEDDLVDEEHSLIDSTQGTSITQANTPNARDLQSAMYLAQMQHQLRVGSGESVMRSQSNRMHFSSNLASATAVPDDDGAQYHDSKDDGLWTEPLLRANNGDELCDGSLQLTPPSQRRLSTSGNHRSPRSTSHIYPQNLPLLTQTKYIRPSVLAPCQLSDGHADSLLRNLDEHEQLELASLWFLDSIHFRTPFLMIRRSARSAHRFLHSSLFRYFRKFVIITHMMLAFFEQPTHSPLPSGITSTIELLACAVYVLELRLHFQIRGSVAVLHNNWKVAKILCVVICIFDAVAFGLAFPAAWPYRPLRMFRAFFLVQNSRDLRANIQYIGKLLPRMGRVLVLVALLILMFGVLGMILFGGIETTYSGYFRTEAEACIRLFELITTVNFPDIMIPSYRESKLYSIYFVTFLLFGLYFLINLVLAVVLFTYRKFLKEDYLHKASKQSNALRASFHLIADADTKVLSREVFAQLFGCAYPGVSQTSVSYIFDALDRDKSGNLDLDEFVDVCVAFREHLRLHARYELRREIARSYIDGRRTFLGRLRNHVRSTVRHRFFRYFVDLALVANAVTIVIEAAQVENGHWSSRWVWFDFAMWGIFVSEIVLKLTGLGSRAFWYDVWNRVDVLLLTIALAALAAYRGSDKATLFYRVLLIFRIVSRIEWFQSLFALVGRLVGPFAINLGMIVAIFYVYAIVGIWAFSGRLHPVRCVAVLPFVWYLQKHEDECYFCMYACVYVYVHVLFLF
jgi:Ion transport protein